MTCAMCNIAVSHVISSVDIYFLFYLVLAALSYADKQGTVFVETSAKSAANIPALFMEISKVFSFVSADIFGVKLSAYHFYFSPGKRLSARRELESIPNTNTISVRHQPKREKDKAKKCCSSS